MKIKVLQGLNLENEQTTIIAEMKKAKPDLIEFFHQMHDIFLHEFEIKDSKTLIVKTDLPSLWKLPEFLEPIEKHALGEIDFQKAQKEMLRITKMQVSSMSSVPIIAAAQRRKLETNQIYTNGEILPRKSMHKNFAVGIGKELGIFVCAATTGDSSFALKTQRNKSYTNQLIESMELPIAKWDQVQSRDQLTQIAEEIGFPLVIKPVGLTAGHGVHVGIKSLEELEKAYDKIVQYFDNMEHKKSAWQKRIIVQKMVPGDDHRVLVVNGKVEIATHRIPARVTGDAEHTIRELIEIENQNPKRDTSKPTHILKPITIDEKLESVVCENGYELDDIPPKDEIVYVRKVASMSQGGITADVTDQIHPQIKMVCESIARTIHANVVGVDVLAEDISKPLTEKNGSIIEMNTMPEIYLNAYPVIGNDHPEIGEKILDGIIDPDVHTNTVVALGDFKPAELIELTRENLGDAGRIGLYCNGDIYIDDQCVSRGRDLHNAILGLKKNASLDTILINYANEAEIAENGFGFNKIDLAITDKSASKKLTERLQELKAKNLIAEINTDC
jgi:cyanophycin synthetase